MTFLHSAVNLHFPSTGPSLFFFKSDKLIGLSVIFVYFDINRAE